MTCKQWIVCIFLFCSSIANAVELPADWELSLTYEGGYSPLKLGKVHIVKQGDQIIYDLYKEYYEEETPPDHKSGTVSEENFRKLLDVLEKNNAWGLNDLLERSATDGFTFMLELRDGTRQHRFSVYFPELQQDHRYNIIIDAIAEAVGLDE